MPIEPVKIPQNVYVEDRIVGPVTLRQLAILLGSGGFSYVLWTGIKSQTGYASIPLTILCWIPFVIGMAFAFVRVQSISLTRFLLLLIEKMEKPAIREWSPRRGIAINFQFTTEKKDEKTKPAPEPHKEKLEELSQILDRDLTPAALPAGEAQAQNAPARPVDPGRIAVETSTAPSVDDVRVQPAPTLPSPGTNPGTLMDLLPPSPSHNS